LLLLVEELKKGLSKPLQDVMLSSDEEEHYASGANMNHSLSNQFVSNRNKNVDSQNDDGGDDEDEEDDEEDDDIT
jgi:hypothetical protein